MATLIQSGAHYIVCATSSLDYLEHFESLQDDCRVVLVAFIVSCHKIDKLCPLPGVWSVERQRHDGKITDTHQVDTQNVSQQHLDEILTLVPLPWSRVVLKRSRSQTAV